MRLPNKINSWLHQFGFNFRICNYFWKYNCHMRHLTLRGQSFFMTGGAFVSKIIFPPIFCPWLDMSYWISWRYERKSEFQFLGCSYFCVEICNLNIRKYNTLCFEKWCKTYLEIYILCRQFITDDDDKNIGRLQMISGVSEIV